MQTIVSESFYCRQARRYSRYEAAVLTANRLGIDKKSSSNERFTCFGKCFPSVACCNNLKPNHQNVCHIQVNCGVLNLCITKFHKSECSKNITWIPLYHICDFKSCSLSHTENLYLSYVHMAEFSKILALNKAVFNALNKPENVTEILNNLVVSHLFISN